MIVRLFGASLLPASARKPALLKKACLKTLECEGAHGRGELNIVFLDRRRMRELNKRYLGHGHDTDVIAFSYPPAKAKEREDPPFGDVFVSATQARVQAGQLGHPVLDEILTLIIHGTLHLLGYEDSTPKKKAGMFRRQERLLSSMARRG